MPEPLQAATVLARLKDYPHDNYLAIGSIIKGIALYSAVVVGLEICHDRRDCKRLIPWVTSLAAITVSYMTWGRGVLLTNSRANLFDSIVPFAMGLVEFALFGLLSPKQFPSAPGSVLPAWRNWFLALALHPALAVCLVGNRIAQTHIVEDYEQQLRPLAEQYIGWMWNDFYGASIVAVLALAVWFWSRREWIGEREALVASALFAVVLFSVVYEADSQRQVIDAFLSSSSGNTPRLPVIVEVVRALGLGLIVVLLIVRAVWKKKPTSLPA